MAIAKNNVFFESLSYLSVDIVRHASRVKHAHKKLTSFE
jgi:hypothetical protein